MAKTPKATTQGTVRESIDFDALRKEIEALPDAHDSVDLRVHKIQALRAADDLQGKLTALAKLSA